MASTHGKRTDEHAAFDRRVDFSRSAADYGRHRAGFPPRLFERLLAFGIGKAGQRVLDLGTGTGTLARGMAAAGCCVTALDPGLAMLVEARRLAAAESVALDLLAAKAEHVPLSAGRFDVVLAGQCWHWFDSPRAAAEARRLLQPGGRLVIAHFDWLPAPGNVVEATEHLILRYNPTWHFAGGNGCYPQWLVDLTAAGFTDLETFSFDHAAPYDHAGWRGRIRASAGVAATLPPADVARFDAELARTLAECFGREPLQVPHRVFAAIGVAPGA